MKYVDLDPILGPWADTHHLHVSSTYRDEEVRSIEVVSPQGRRYQIWLDLGSGGHIGVHVWDYKKQRADFAALPSELRLTLDAALAAAQEWMEAEVKP